MPTGDNEDRQQQIDAHRRHRQPHEAARIALEEDQARDGAERQDDQGGDGLPVPHAGRQFLEPGGKMLAHSLAARGRGIERLLPDGQRAAGDVLGRGRGREGPREDEVDRAKGEQGEEKEFSEPAGDERARGARLNRPRGASGRQCRDRWAAARTRVTTATSTVTSGARRPAAPKATEG